ncbi:WG repeat-containing protein [Gordoniibacillus kamchatkensis]|uniref:WG repeat-containing protein n=1 Tax=Gordoniibacillus kamchatkensis TaxID=1590651 RepID=UPI0006985F79|nr:WG repeat-containing protein [Paenibacillus sp. VKM B-2647]
MNNRRAMCILFAFSLLLAQLLVPTAQAQGGSNEPIYAIKPQFHNGPFSFHEGMAFADGSFIDRTGNVLFKLPYSYYAFVERDPYYLVQYTFNEGLASVSPNKGSTGVINNSGEEVVSPKYGMVYPYNEGMAAVSKVDVKSGNPSLSCGYIDTSGNEIIKRQFGECKSFSEGLAVVGPPNGMFDFSATNYFIDKSGNKAFQTEFSNAFSFSDGLAQVRPLSSNYYGYIDKTGKMVIPAQYKHANDFNEGLAVIEVDGKYGAIDKNEKFVIQPKYDFMGNKFSEGLAVVSINDKYGFIDKSGRIAISPQFEKSPGYFSEGLARVRINGKYGYIDKSGNVVIKAMFDDATDFSEGLAAVKIDGLWGYVINPNDTVSDWARSEIQSASSLNLIPIQMHYGYTTNISRSDFSKLAVHLLEVKTGKSISTLLSEKGKTLDTSAFNDTTDPSILAAYSLGIVGGKGNGIFDPNGDITRQEAAVMLARTAKVLAISNVGGNVTYADADEIAGWAKDSVSLVSAIKDKTNQSPVMGSTGDNNFSPKASYTKQQAFITMKRLFNALQ